MRTKNEFFQSYTERFGILDKEQQLLVISAYPKSIPLEKEHRYREGVFNN